MSCWGLFSSKDSYHWLLAYAGSSGCLKCILDTQQLRLAAASSGSYSMLPAVLAGLLGAGVLETAYAEADEVCAINISGQRIVADVSLHFYFSSFINCLFCIFVFEIST